MNDKNEEDFSVNRLVKNIEVVCPPNNLESTSVSQGSVAVREYCKKSSIVYHQPKSLLPSEIGFPLFDSISNKPLFDLGVVVSFGHKIPVELIQSLKYGAINMHPSLLPKYRGAAPIHHALLNNDKETGVSIIQVHPTKMDFGKIFLQKKMVRETLILIVRTFTQHENRKSTV